MTLQTGAGASPSAGKAVGGGLLPLSSVPVPLPSNLADFVQDKQAAIALGKAMFWDMQAGSDGLTACATCHFAALADTRPRNSLNPGGPSFGQGFYPNFDLTAGSYPFHSLATPDDRNSTVLFDTPARTSSQGVFPSTFTGITEGSQIDGQTTSGPDPAFSLGGINVRRVEPRNTPTIINGIFNFRNFWDGRAQNDFNGVNPFGSRDPNARVVVAGGNGDLSRTAVSIDNASVASQAVGPPTSPFEMSAAGRQLRDVGKKLLALTPLALQKVSTSDSVLAPMAVANGRGLNTTYANLVKAAFKAQWWSSSQIVLVGPNGKVTFLPASSGGGANRYTQMQYNWSLFWGLAIDLYVSTLVSDQTPLDRFLAGDHSALSALQQKGLTVFQSDKASCSTCHAGPELTSASVSNVGKVGKTSTFTRNGTTVTFDTGFTNNGVRPTPEDVGLGGLDPFGQPLSVTLLTGTSGPVAVAGAFKVPGLRNVALTAPFFHNGGELTLEQVVEFYDRGGNFTNSEQHPLIRPLGLTDKEDAALVAFLEMLTDPRVENQSAPFDHPQIFVPNGEVWVVPGVLLLNDGTGRAVDNFTVIAEIGAAGGAPVVPFPNPGTTGAPPTPH